MAGFRMRNAEAYVECHFYSAGLKSKFFGDLARPSYLPSYESVGLANEALLREDDYCVEFIRRCVDNRKIGWLAVHVPAVDEVYGDRGNYCGVGVWLVECAPCAVFKLLDALMQLARVLSKQGVSSLFEKGVVKFCQEYLGSHLIPLEFIPLDFSGIAYLSGEFHKSDYRFVHSPWPIQERLGAVAVSVLAACYKREAGDANRVVYFDCPSGRITTSPVDVLAMAQAATTVDAILRRQLSDASQDIARANQAEIRLEEMIRSLDRVKAELERKDASIASLISENGTLREGNASLSEKNDRLQKAIESRNSTAVLVGATDLQATRFSGKSRQEVHGGVMLSHDAATKIHEDLGAIKSSLKRMEERSVQTSTDMEPETASSGWRDWLWSNLLLCVAFSVSVVLIVFVMLWTVLSA
jgi:hypothetical protein